MVYLPFALVVALVVVGLLFLLNDRWRRGAAVFGVAAVFAGMLRVFLPDSRVGLLAVRGRIVDSVFLILIGIGLTWMAASIASLGTG